MRGFNAKKKWLPAALVLFLATGQSALAAAPFAGSDASMASRANEFWTIYGLGEGTADDNGYRGGDNTAWTEWDAMKFAWTGYNGYRTIGMDWLKNSAKINGLNGVTGTQADGFVWSWAISEAWPDDESTHGGVGSYHFDQLPRYVAAIYDYYVWTRNATFLSTMLPRAEFVMDNYILGTMQANTGVAIIPLASNNGTTSSRPSTYWDQLKSGFKEAWINGTLYTALQNLADLEDMAGNTTKRNTYQNLANLFPARYDAAFWNSATNRYAGWRDSAGNLHDAGYTYVNTEALARGLGNTDKANRIFDWLDGQASQATAGGQHIGSTDVYQLVVAPRTNTSAIPSGEVDGWSDPPTGHMAYGEGLPDGGAVMWTAYYDIMARLRYNNADDAYARFAKLLVRMASDTHRLTYNPANSRYYNDFGESIVELGTNTPFPESGIAVLPYLHGFMGVNATKNGLELAPNLPTELVYAQTSGVNFNGSDLTVKTSRAAVVAEQAASNGVVSLGSGTLSQTFTPPSSFNEAGLFVGTYQTSTSGFTAQLDKLVGGTWTKVATRKFVNVPDNSWLYMGFPDQAGGAQYRLTLSAGVGSIAWYRDSASSFSGTAGQNGSAIAGDFIIRADNAWQSSLISQNTHSTADLLNVSLGQTFQTSAPFDRVGMTIGTYATSNSGFTASLYQDVGGRWSLKAKQSFANVLDNSEVIMNFASQPAGKYLLEITDKSGSIAWYRNASDVYTGAGLYALTDGSPVAGDRRFSVYLGKYRIEVPAKSVDVTVDAGNRYIIPS